MILLRRLLIIPPVNYRTYKNFGHKRQPLPTITFLWHGFLTFTFVGMCIEWKKIAGFIFGDKDSKSSTQGAD